MPAQKPTPSVPRTATRVARPRSAPFARTRAVSHFGSSMWRIGTRGRSAKATSRAGVRRDGVRREGVRRDGVGDGGRTPRAPFSRIQHLGELASGALAGEPQKDALEPRGPGGGVRLQIVHGAAGADLSTLDDADAVAHGLGNFERVR